MPHPRLGVQPGARPTAGPSGAETAQQAFAQQGRGAALRCARWAALGVEWRGAALCALGSADFKSKKKQKIHIKKIYMKVFCF